MIGSMMRYGLGTALSTLFKTGDFPLGTSVVNLFGCLAAGVVGQILESRGTPSPELRAFISVGILGGFTTFSAFAHEAESLLNAGKLPLATCDVALQVVGGIFAVACGRALVGCFVR